MSDARTALEAALAARPGDVAIHSAYADFLAEAGDPRGDYIRLQLALEDRNQATDRLRAMEQEAFAIRREHEREWLGPLAPFVFPDRGPSVGAMVAEPVAVTWRRGWVHSVEIDRLNQARGKALRLCPSARLLKQLAIRDSRDRGLRQLARAPWLRGLRRLSVGTDIGVGSPRHGVAIARLLPRARRLAKFRCVSRHVPIPLEQLPFARTLTELELVSLGSMRHVLFGLARVELGKLRRLVLDNSSAVLDPDVALTAEVDRSARLRLFFTTLRTPVLTNLTLRLRGFGDSGVDELIASGLIRRLRGLDLCRCEITDDGAVALAACPDVRALEYLHLDNNYLSPVGVETLARVGVTVSGRQWFADNDPGGEYLA